MTSPIRFGDKHKINFKISEITRIPPKEILPDKNGLLELTIRDKNLPDWTDDRHAMIDLVRQLPEDRATHVLESALSMILADEIRWLEEYKKPRQERSLPECISTALALGISFLREHGVKVLERET